MNSIDLDGNGITARTNTTRCGECGMPTLSHREFHPYEACEIFKATHDSREVRAVLRRLFLEMHDRRAARSQGDPEEQEDNTQEVYRDDYNPSGEVRS